MTTWQELQAEVADRLAAASPDERVVFAVGVAERLMRAQEALPAHEQAEYALGLRPTLNALWEAALGNMSAFGEIKHGLGEHLLSEYCHNDGQAGPGDADGPAAAAVLHTAVAYLFGAGDPIQVVSSRAVEAAGERLPTGDSNAVDPDEMLIAELHRQVRDLTLIGQHSASLRHARLGLDIDTSARLHRALRIPLSTVGTDV
ncbi:hypothetical protein PYK79_32300 [Streptomyces sp. ID05-04B]|uniref:hypothetical protein n=1 Tax=Streptomyces sp. ID05-04B TaxID=3028661 RepID=UPI0029C10747|nr:hypothetical protein [Streptomyces sp. ID05-04B]MDX5566972.1 hypothetical protein [Streptomyces sp. ID05-04B]